MKKAELIQYLESGGSFTADASGMAFSTLVRFAEAAAKGGGTLSITNTGRLFHSEILTLCKTAPGKVAFPDAKLAD